MTTLHQQITSILRANKFDSKINTIRNKRAWYEVSKLGTKVYLFTADYFQTENEAKIIKVISDKWFNIVKSEEGAEDSYIITK